MIGKYTGLDARTPAKSYVFGPGDKSSLPLESQSVGTLSRTCVVEEGGKGGLTNSLNYGPKTDATLITLFE